MQVLQALRERGPLSTTDLLRLVFQNHDAKGLQQTLAELEAAGLIVRRTKDDTGGRPATVWALAPVETP